ncbi:MAG: hypothetical protein LBG06_06960 [Deltaproteobacteria bacterium]|jgi:hypothetical protein|nr:hypothetical protein [Deltaproteobacteria bacterium]
MGFHVKALGDGCGYRLRRRLGIPSERLSIATVGAAGIPPPKPSPGR